MPFFGASALSAVEGASVEFSSPKAVALPMLWLAEVSGLDEQPAAVFARDIRRPEESSVPWLQQYGSCLWPLTLAFLDHVQSYPVLETRVNPWLQRFGGQLSQEELRKKLVQVTKDCHPLVHRIRSFFEFYGSTKTTAQRVPQNKYMKYIIYMKYRSRSGAEYFSFAFSSVLLNRRRIKGPGGIVSISWQQICFSKANRAT